MAVERSPLASGFFKGPLSGEGVATVLLQRAKVETKKSVDV